MCNLLYPLSPVPVNRPPMIQPSSLAMSVDEEVERGTLVGRVQVRDLDTDLDNYINVIPMSSGDGEGGETQEHHFYTLDLKG